MMKKIWVKYKSWLKYWKLEIVVLILLFKHPLLPRFPKWIVLLLLSYIFSPIDLIPDFIPMIGHIDDFMLIPITLWLIRKITPAVLIMEVREYVRLNPNEPLFNSTGTKIAAIMIFLLWIGITIYLISAFEIMENIQTI